MGGSLKQKQKEMIINFKLFEIYNKTLILSNKGLKELPDLSNLINLEYLICDNNQLTELPDLSNLINLKKLYCNNNRLPYNNLSEYKKWYREKNLTEEEKRLIKLKTMDIDPYGEEKWED